MYKFRKLPVEIEAFQMTKARGSPCLEWPGWLYKAWYCIEEGITSVSYTGENGKLGIKTLEGLHIVSWNDWIIQGIKGELYACKPDIFEKTYESVSEK